MAANSAKKNVRGGWRRRAAQKEAKIVHRWQSADVPDAEKRQQREGRGKRIAMLALLAAAAGLVVIYVRSLLLSPLQTPVVIVTAGPYPAPFAPNSWATKDAEALKDLDGKTLSVARTSHVSELEALLRSAIQRQRGCQSVVIVLSMHGGVDEAGSPCLIPPNASPLDSKTWIPLAVVLARIRNSGVPDDVHKLLVLDCNRVQVSWEQGTLYNLFAESLEISQVVAKSGIPNLVVMNSTRPGQRGWATRQLQGTVFGHFLRAGLAGAADSKSEGGDGDRSVSFQELLRYVDAHVDRWVRHHLADRQRPLVLTSQGTARDSDFHITWALRGALPEKPLSEPVVSRSEIDSYWNQHDRFRTFDPMTYDPLTWADFQRTLLRLERTAAAGPGYSVMTRKAQVRLKELVALLQKQQAEATQSATRYRRLEIFSQFAGPRVRPLNVFSLPLANFLGALDEEEIKAATGFIGDFRQSPTGETLKSHLGVQSGRPSIPDLDAVHFLRLLHRYQIAELWPEADLARLIELRDLAAAAAVPHDERIRPWVQSAVESGDGSRRLAENAIFAGSQNMTDEWEQHRKAAQADYVRAQTLATRLTDAYRLSDRISAELPWLANWLLHRDAGDTSAAPDAETPNTVLNRLIQSKRELEAALRKPGTALADILKRCTDDFEKLNRLYDEECRELLNAERADAHTLRRIHAVLQVPLVPSGQRAEFHDKRVDSRRRLQRAAAGIAEKLSSTYSAVSAADAAQTTGGKDDESAQPAAELLIRLDMLERFGQSSIHPVLSLLDVAAPETDSEPTALETQRDTAESVRRLTAVQHRFQKRLLQIAQTIEQSQNLAETDPSVYRATLLNAEEALRKTGAFPVPQLSVDPNARRRRFDLQQLLAWHADRSIEDFWGAATIDERPFFQRAALGYWESAVDFDSGFAGIHDQRKASREWLDRRVAVSKSGIVTNAAPARQLSTGDDVDVAVSVSLTSTRPAAGPKRPALPSGIGAVFLANAQGRIGKQLQPVAIPNPRESKNPLALLKFQIASPLLDKSSSGLSAVTLFRGHAFSAPLSIGMPGGVSVTTQPQPQLKSTLTLTGTKENPASVVFILDCSQSMNRKTSQPGSPTRMQVAVRAVSELMDQLVKRGNTQVGVLFYGHRVGWNTEGTQIVRQTAYDPNIDKELLPLEDVETVATLGRFDAAAANFVKSRLKRLQPWGETPLFLSISEAMKQLSVADADSNRRIVVITDGENNQYIPRDLQLTEEQTAKLTELGDITGMLRKNPVPVHILGFEMNPEEARRSQAAFRQITRTSGGTHVPAVNARILFPTLESLLGPSRYSVRDRAGTTVATAALGSPVVLKRNESRQRELTVEVGTARASFQVEGGEAFQLVISQNGNDIESVRYTTGQPRFAPLVVGEIGAASGILAGVHLPARGGTDRRDVTFPVSFQREDRGIPGRFHDVWIEITPLAKDGQPAAEPYVFLDPQYAPGKPVPVVNLTATNWPKNAARAALRLWCHNRRVTPTRSMPIANLIATGKAADATAAVTVAGRELTAATSTSEGRFVVRVVERLVSPEKAYAPSRIELAPKTPAGAADNFEALQIVRRFDVKNGVTVHRFEFPADAEAAVRRGLLAVTDRNAIVGPAARQLARPLIVDVAKPGGVIRLKGPVIP